MNQVHKKFLEIFLFCLIIKKYSLKLSAWEEFWFSLFLKQRKAVLVSQPFQKFIIFLSFGKNTKSS